MASRPSSFKFLASACLAGINCTYNAGNNLDPAIRKLFLSGECLSVCPEVMGGLPVPRPPAEICGARVINAAGKDVTKECMRGTAIILRLAKRYRIRRAILKSNSPCCGKGRIYDGTFTGEVKKGNGILTSAVIRSGIKVYSEKDLKSHLRRW